AGLAQAACTRCGDCCAGCNVGAKNTVALTYLPDAVRHGAEAFTGLKAETVRRSADGTWQVALRAVAPERGEAAEITIEAPVVVLAAGTLGSTEILLRSRAAGLALSDRLGFGFSA